MKKMSIPKNTLIECIHSMFYNSAFMKKVYVNLFINDLILILFFISDVIIPEQKTTFQMVWLVKCSFALNKN